MTARRVFPLLRVLMALAIIAAIVAQLIVSVGFWRDRGDTAIAVDVANFLSFFTIQSNILAAITLLLGARWVSSDTAPRWYGPVAAAMTTYMVTTGLVYNTLLRGIELPQGSTVDWSNEVLHLIAPLYILIDWLCGPGARSTGWRTVLGIAIYPLAWLAYTLVRGPLVLNEGTGETFWYPYPFLNPHLGDGGYGGYGTVALYSALIAVAIIAVACAVIALGRARGRRSDARPPLGSA